MRKASIGSRASRRAGELTFRLLNFGVLRRLVKVTDGALGDLRRIVLSLSLNADVVVTGSATFRNIADVENPAENLVGIASAASQGAITAEQLEVRPIMRAGEVLETVPGMIVSQHSGEGKANQYYLRGFNLDHGTDFSTTVAGVPVNTPTGAHAHGYADVGFLIPELVSGVQFKKGPYFADEGDFSAAGAASINYVNQLDRPMVAVQRRQRWMGACCSAQPPRASAAATCSARSSSNHNDGPWVRPDDYQKINGVVRYSRGDNRNGFSLTGMGYWSDWDSTDQVANRAIASGLISRFGFLDPTDGGRTSRQSHRGGVPALDRSIVGSRRPRSCSTTASTCSRTSRTSWTIRNTAINSSRPSAGRPPEDGSPTGGSATSSSGTPRTPQVCRSGVTGSRRWASITPRRSSGCRQRGKTRSVRR